MKNDQNPATAYHTITTARRPQHPLIYTGARPIHLVHGPVRSPATEAIAPKGFTFSPFLFFFVCKPFLRASSKTSGTVTVLSRPTFEATDTTPEIDLS